MGIGTIRNAKRIVLLAWGINKAGVIKETIEGEITSKFLQLIYKDITIQHYFRSRSFCRINTSKNTLVSNFLCLDRTLKEKSNCLVK